MEQTKSVSQRDAAIVTHSNSLPKRRMCAGNCGTEIPRARLKARPNAAHCVRCLTAKGDVPLIREENRGAYVNFADVRAVGEPVTPRISPENTSIKTLSLNGAIRVQEALLARENAARVRGYQESQSLK